MSTFVRIHSNYADRITKKIRALKERSGLTFARIANQCDVQTGTVQRWVSGERLPRLPHLAKLDLIGGKSWKS